MSTTHIDPILGTAVGDTVARIMGDALRLNTAEGWHDAAQQLWGLDRLIGSIRAEGASWGTFYAIAISNEISRCHQMEDSPEHRAQWATHQAKVKLLDQPPAPLS